MRLPLSVAFLLAVLSLFSAGTLRANGPVQRELPDGIAFKFDDTVVEAKVASPHAFCLRVDPSASTAAPRSVYLVDQPPTGATFKVIHVGAAVGLETSFGQLLIDPDRRMWCLRDLAGAVLSNWVPFGDPVNASGNLEFSIGSSPTVAQPLHYGSGTIPNRGALNQIEGNSTAGNGTTMLPQYWTTAGYGVLLVGNNDHAPGAWKPDTSGAVKWQVPGHGADLYLCPARDLYAWLRAQAELTGFAPVPPQWTFGYMQSRWGWKDKAYIDDTLAHFRQDRLPVDTFIIDFEWYTTSPDYGVKPEGSPDYADFNWNPRLFPDPPTQVAAFAQQGIHLVGIRKPRLGNSENLKTARGQGWILQPGQPGSGESAGFKARDLDFTKPAARTWWASNHRHFLDDGMSAFWNDEGELDFVEYSYWNLAEKTLQQQVHPEKRFWSLNRSMAPGLQRLGAAVWTGDYEGTWTTLARQPGEMLSYSLAGMPYTGCDIGGMNNEMTPELLTRWMQAGVFFPVMRAHSDLNVTPHFPWLYGSEAEDAMRKALDLRYRLIPYYYSLAHENSVSAAPLMRPLAMEFPGDEKTSGLTDEWLMGTGLLAAPLMNEGGTRTIYLPKDRWYNFDSAQQTEGPQSFQVTAKLDEIPIYVRAGTLLPLGPVRQWTSQPSQEPLELRIYGGRNAEFTFVEDNGENPSDPANARRVTKFSWNEQTRQLNWTVTGSYHDDKTFQAMKAIFCSAQGQAEKSGILGQDGSLTFP